jgi:hypothetical protein
MFTMVIIQQNLLYLVLDYLEISINRQVDKEWSDTVVCYRQLLYCVHLLQGVTVQCLEYFSFVIEGAGKKEKRVVLIVKAKIGLSMRLLSMVRYMLSIMF